MCNADLVCLWAAKIKSFRLRRVTFVSTDVNASGLPAAAQDQKLPPSAGDFCYGKSHQNHLRRTAAATRFPARLARQAPRRTRAIHGPRTIGACSPVGLRCSAAFKARQVKISMFLPVVCVCTLCRIADLCHAGCCFSLRLKSTPSGAAWRGAKVRMFERMDARVRTGPRHASRAGHRRVAPTCVRREWFCRLLP